MKKRKMTCNLLWVLKFCKLDFSCKAAHICDSPKMTLSLSFPHPSSSFSRPYRINAPIHFELIELFRTTDIFHFRAGGKTAYCWLNLSKQHLYKLFFFTPLLQLHHSRSHPLCRLALHCAGGRMRPARIKH